MSYLHYFKLRFITNLQYRAAALAGIATQFFFGMIFILVYYAFYKSNSNSSLPMDWNNLVTYIWLSQAFYALIYPYERDAELLNMIKDGNLAYEILRPENLFIKFYVKMIAKKMVSSLLRCFPVIMISFIIPNPFKLSLPLSLIHFILFLISLLISCLLVSVLTIIVHILTMFTIDSKGIIGIYSVISEVFSGATIPIPFFPEFLKKIAYILPFRYICDLPFRIYSGDIILIEGITLLMQASLWIITLIILGLLITRSALKKAVIQGG